MKNIFSAVFFKDNETARARSGSQNRRKQAKIEVLSTEKFFQKSEKARKKRFFPSCCVTAPRPDSTVPRSTEGQRTEYTRSDIVLKTIWCRVIHRKKWLSTGFSTGGEKAQKSTECTKTHRMRLSQKSTFRVYYKTAFRHFSAVYMPLFYHMGHILHFSRYFTSFRKGSCHISLYPIFSPSFPELSLSSPSLFPSSIPVSSISCAVPEFSPSLFSRTLEKGAFL